MTEDASRPDDTQEAERDEESSDDATTVADPEEPVTVAPDADEDADAGDDTDEASASGDDSAFAATGERSESDGVSGSDRRERADGSSDEGSESDGVTVEQDDGGASVDGDGTGTPGQDAGSDAVDDVTAADGETDADESATGGSEDAGEAEIASETDGRDDVPAAGDAGSDETADDPDDADDTATADVESAEDSAVEDAPDAVAAEDDADTDADAAPDAESAPGPGLDLPPDVRKYDRFTKMDGAQYERVNEFLRDRTYITAREWAIARLCADFRTETGVEMTKIGENLPYLVPFMTDTYTPQAVNQARSAFEDKVRQAGATFLYGAMCDFFTADELDDLMYEVTEVAKFLLEVEGVDLTVEEELEAEDRISTVMREVRQSSDELRNEGICCPECGHEFESEAHEAEAHEAE